ncbi:MAG: arginine deiminase-related protein [Mucilaginibacter sp.]|uniref:citrulline utilization hydrolase CtlX n=1 Tax=Mucilaginibacter sp. TaxID=1882438 RepID=UPI003267920F
MNHLTSHILMIRPVSFGFNEQTAESNAFQHKSIEEQNIQEMALAEFDAFAEKLKDNGLDVIIAHDTTEPHTPDSIFPNNWVSFHEDGKIFIYPMQAENRRLERDIKMLKKTTFNDFVVSEIKDLSPYEHSGEYLEGTGSMVLDRENKIAYACLSPRTHPDVIKAFRSESGYTSILFHATDQNGKAIYHTNVMMCLGDEFVVICLDAVTDAIEKNLLMASFEQTNKQVIEISQQQLNEFAGNMLELKNDKGERLLIMSARAHASLEPEQVKKLEKYCKIVSASLETIETIGGGSARCMIAEVHLPVKN